MPNTRKSTTRKSTTSKNTGGGRNRKGLLPGEYRKRSIVYVERLRGQDEPRKHTDGDSMYTTDAFIVLTRRVDTDWSFIMEHNGVQTQIPSKVMERFLSQREAIIKEQRSDRGRERANRVARRLLAEE